MKYFKFAQISEETGVSWAIEQPISGPSWPKIDGLDLNKSIQLSYEQTYYIAPVSNKAKANPDNHIFELSFEEYANALKRHVEYLLDEEKNHIYQEEFNFRQSIFGKYHDTATVAGIYKYQQAKAIVEDEDTDAPDLLMESQTRGVDIITIANRIIENHEAFRNKDAKIAGIRGKILDRINAYTFDLEKPNESYAEFLTEEVIGTKLEMNFEDGEMVEKEFEVKVRKYQLNLGTRFQYE
jgi:uncharacterized DUF497 family protein